MDKLLTGLGCIIPILIIVFNVVIGTWAVQYLLLVWLQKDIAFGWDLLLGLITAEIAVPAAIITWILTAAGAI